VAVGDADPSLDLRQEQNAEIRGQPPAVEIHVHGIAGDR
jgi:hypothetical protein